MASNESTRGNATVLITLLFLQLLLMAGSARDRRGATRLESWGMGVTSPVMAIGSALGGVVHGVMDSAWRTIWARERNRVLERQVHILRDDLRDSAEFREQNKRLRELVSMREALAPASIAANVVRVVNTSQERMLVVDVGSDDGIRPELAVVAWGGAVGRVERVSSGFAKVRLLSDPASGVGAVVQSLRAHGIIVGVDDDRFLDLLYVPSYAEVSHGDLVLTSGHDGIFPRGFTIGVVTAIERNPDALQRIQVHAAVDYGALEEVLILLEPVAGKHLLPDVAEAEAE